LVHISESYLFFSSHFQKGIKKSISSDEVGQKAKSLLACQSHWTPPFIIINSSLFRKWNESHDDSDEVITQIANEIIVEFEKLGVKKYIIRSSAKNEGFEERGFYNSIQKHSTKENLTNGIRLILDQNKTNVTVDNEFAIIIQEFIEFKLLGHLSNERRICRNITDWVIESVNERGEALELTRFSVTLNGPSLIETDQFNCFKKPELIKALKLFAKFLSSKKQRCHVEWIWDSKRLWIVQKDIDAKNDKGNPPGSNWAHKTVITGEFNPIALTKNSITKKSWRKTKCINTFRNCGLPTGEVYILENAKIIKKLSEGKRDEELTKDLETILKYPILIRMDISKSDGYNNILLPRTETLFTIEQAYDFLFANAKKFTEQGLKQSEFCFLLHRFINSKACALAFSKPRIPRVRIDSTWGIVDGLYYHPHDSFEVNRVDNSIKKKIRCKTEFLDVDNDGKWFSRPSGVKWDWAESLNQNQLINIANYTNIIANYLDSPVTVMYFVDIDTTTGYPHILPWFYTTEEIPESSEKFTETIFSEVKKILNDHSGFSKLKEEIEQNNQNKFTIKLKLTPGILREKEFIEEVGLFCFQKSIPIELDGSILSHTYYILRKAGAIVKCADPFEPKYKKQKFYKLVRDKIPVNIESVGEIATTIEVDSAFLLSYLKGKMVEEAYEFYWENDEDKIIEEMADVLEVIRSACKIFGISIQELLSIADKKVETKGGFEKGILLLETSESNLIKTINQQNIGLALEFENAPHKIQSAIKGNKYLKSIQSENGTFKIPYFIESNSSKRMPRLSLKVEEGKSISVAYNKKNMEIRLINQENYKNPKQLDLFEQIHLKNKHKENSGEEE
jgi:predicted house-cleaning noncanonical NTP pyrophosphatase (MazG superfamily)